MNLDNREGLSLYDAPILWDAIVMSLASDYRIIPQEHPRDNTKGDSHV